MLNLKFYATSDEEGNVIVFPEEPRFSKEAEGHIGRFGSFMLPKRKNNELVKKIVSKLNGQTGIVELNLFATVKKK